MNGRLILVAGPLRRSLFGKTYQPFGVQAPQASALLTPTVGGVPIRLPADTYDLFVTTYVSATGAESNPTYLGEFTTDGNNDGLIQVTLANTGVLADKWRIYVRRQSTQAIAYRLTDVYLADDSIVSSDGDILISANVVVVNVSSEVLADLILPVPLAHENDEMPADTVFVATYGRRLIAASRRKLYWSKLDIPDAFPPENFEIIDTGEGDEITGIVPTTGEQLLVFTTSSVWVVDGIDPQYWRLKPIDTTVGCVGRKSIVAFDDAMAWWSPQYGPVLMAGGQIEKIGYDLLGKQTVEGVTPFDWPMIVSGWDPSTTHIVWGITGTGDVKPTLLWPYNYRLKTWAASYWDPSTVGGMATGRDNHGRQRLFLIDDGYRLSYLDDTYNYDALPGGTATGTFVAGSSEISTIAGTGFYNQTYGANTADLRRLRVTIVDSAGQFVARRTIQSNTTTSITLRRSVLVTSGATYTYYICTPHMQLMTNWFDGDQPFLRKRHDRLYVDVQCSESTVPLLINVQLNNDASVNAKTFSVLAENVVAGTVDATWDATLVLSVPFVKKRLGVWKNGHNCRVTFMQAQPVKSVVSKIVVSGRMLSDRYYA